MKLHVLEAIFYSKCLQNFISFKNYFVEEIVTAQAMTFFIKDWSHLLRKSLMENFIFSLVWSCVSDKGQEVYNPIKHPQWHFFGKIVDSLGTVD